MNRIIKSLAIAVLSAGVPSLASATITPNPFAFGNVEVGQSSPAQVFTMTNTLQEQMTIVSAVIGGANPDQYILDATTCTVGAVINPGSNCTLTVRFAPNAPGNQVALVRVAVTAPPPNPPGGIEFNAVVSGNGTEPPPPPPPAPARAVPTLSEVALAAAVALMLLATLLTRQLRKSDQA